MFQTCLVKVRPVTKSCLMCRQHGGKALFVSDGRCTSGHLVVLKRPSASLRNEFTVTRSPIDTIVNITCKNSQARKSRIKMPYLSPFPHLLPGGLCVLLVFYGPSTTCGHQGPTWCPNRGSCKRIKGAMGAPVVWGPATSTDNKQYNSTQGGE